MTKQNWQRVPIVPLRRRSDSPRQTSLARRRAVQAGIERWRQAALDPQKSGPVVPDFSAYSTHAQRGVLADIPKPSRLPVEWSGSTVSVRPKREGIRAGWLRTIGRLFVWIGCFLRYRMLVAWDWLRRRSSEEQRAKRLRSVLERGGPTLIKFGQQMAIRLDLISYPLSVELQKMLDKVPEFDSDEAIEIVQNAIGKPLDEVFEAFDPDAIGSASIACVYQAVLQSGERVAVKVRRPGIRQTLAADMRALGWLCWLLEQVFLPPGFSRNAIDELQTMLAEELDLAREARFIDLFRTGAREAKLNYVTSPKVYHDLSNERVLVIEFVTGTWLTELLGAVEAQDEDALAILHRRNIDPKVVARRYLKVNRFGGFEGLFFHADLHPANVVVHSGNRLTLIDFGSCGSFPEHELVVWRRLLDAQANNDVGAMVQAALGLMEPLPPIDADEFRRKLESVFWQDLYAIKDKKSKWWERTSANLWIHFLKLAREHNVPMNLNTLRMIRATMLADTIASRIDNDLDPYEEFRNYEREAGWRARERLFERLDRSLGPKRFIRFEEVIKTSETFLYRVQRVLDDTSRFLSFSARIGKAAASVVLGLRTVATMAVIVGAWVGIRFIFGYELPPYEDLPDLVDKLVIDDPWLMVIIGIVILITARKLMYRLHEKHQSTQS